MSENNHEELFKTTLMGGFDKDDVMTKVQNLKDQAYAVQKKLEAKIENGASHSRYFSDELDAQDF